MDVTLGQIIEGNPGRDAIHVACAPMTAAVNLAPGQHVGIIVDGISGPCEKPIGIVDPFLASQVLQGQKFWLVLYQKTITSLKHTWEHPAFDPKQDAVGFITQFASNWDYTFDEFMAGADDFVENNNRLDDKWQQLDDDTLKWGEFWDHYKSIRGKDWRDTKRSDGGFVTCCADTY